MSVPKGGRGKKAPYNTVVMRVPEDLAFEVEALTERYRQFVIDGIDTQESLTLMGVEEARENASKIIKQKKNARISLAKLLQVIYRVDVNPSDL